VDFDDTPAEAEFRAEARAWLQAHAVPKGHPDDFSDGHADESVPEAVHTANCQRWQRTLHEGGWAGIAWPKVFGGRGGKPMEASIFNQEQSKFGVTTGVFAIAHGMVGPTLMRHGTPEQQQRYLPAMLRGDDVWCQLFSEPGAGSDLASLSTKAVRDGDEWVVTGQKVWTSQAEHSTLGILLARTDPDVPKHKGITYFILDMATPGLDIRPLRQITGHAHFSEVFLDEVRIPAANVVGEVNGGWACAITTLSNERAAISGSDRGKEFNLLLDLARERGATGDAVVRQRLADSWTRHQILTFLGYRMQTALSKGTPMGAEASVLKLFYAEHIRRLAALALDIEGPEGQLWRDARGDAFWQRRFLAAPSIKIAGGTNEVQHNVLGERILGLPPEPRTDREVSFRESLRAGT
jgi:alkylation response protein AidB-like acyl-CoA dehydrogenase